MSDGSRLKSGSPPTMASEQSISGPDAQFPHNQSNNIASLHTNPHEGTNRAPETTIPSDHQAFAAFVRTYFLDAQGRPDRTKIKEPIRGALFHQNDLPKMWSIVKNIPGLVLLRKNAEQVLIGWEDTLREETLRAFDKRKSFYRHLWNLHAVLLNLEPKLFLQRYLDLDFSLNGQPCQVNRDLTSVLINTRMLINQSVLTDLREREPELILKTHDGVAVVGWNMPMVDGEIGRLMWGTTRYSEAIDKDGEAKHQTTYWTSQAAVHKAAGGDRHQREYLWACHRAIWTQINQAPGPPLNFDFSKLPGTYLVKISWNNLKPEFQFPNWDSESPKTDFSCCGREPTKGDMILRIEPSEADKKHELKGRFNFGLIEGTMIVHFAEEIPNRQASGSEQPTTAGGSKNPRQRRRRRADDPAPVRRGKHRRVQAEPSGPVYTNEQVPRKLHVVHFQMNCRLTQAALGRGGSGHETLSNTTPLSINTLEGDNHGQFRYHDGAPTLYIGAKG